MTETSYRLARPVSLESEAEMAKAGDIDGLVKANMRIVVTIAAAFAKHGLDVDDLIQEGNGGLVEAAKRYDHTRGVRLGTYAAHWIRARLNRYTMSNWSLIRAGSTRVQRRLFHGIRAAQRALQTDDDAAIAARLEVSEQQVADMKRLLEREVPIDGVEVPGDADLDESHDGESLRDAVRASAAAFTERLDDRERDVFQSRLVDFSATLQQVGARWGVSRERVRQIETDLRRRFRRFLLASPRIAEYAAELDYAHASA
ncbi:MAG: sigma-70 family RNA polymerase sigma factor [Desulfurellales bacterium]|nr:MAG: sigma-70 family RNA polymerase sigma factor [Desulfurellales bacterium]